MTVVKDPSTINLSPAQKWYLKKLIDADMNTLRDLMVDDPQNWNSDFQLAKQTLEAIGG